jgi:hypothetical protein
LPFAAQLVLGLAPFSSSRAVSGSIWYVRTLGRRRTLSAALHQATSLPFIVAATQIGLELGELGEATGAALVGAGILSVVLFPAGSLVVLRGEDAAGGGVSDASSP